jgi:hypothetical protein
MLVRIMLACRYNVDRRNHMSSLKRWRQIGQGQFHKWETAGEEFEGTWRGMHDGRFGLLGTLETSEGLVTFPLHAALLERLKHVREGAEVLVRYTGKQTSKAGRVFKAFEVFVAGADALVDTSDFPLPRIAGDES